MLRVPDLLRDGFPYSRTLAAHSSCVNAIAFSKDGRYMLSGGDDLTVLSWDFHQEDLRHPVYSHIGPHGNIFTLAFSCNNQHIFAGGVDEIVYKYDAASLDRSPSAVFRHHQGTVRAISPHPFNDDIVLTCSEDGKIVILDTRTNSPPQARNTLQLSTEVAEAQYHPFNEHLFLTGDHAGNLALRDARMAFGSLKDRQQQQRANANQGRRGNSGGIVRHYCTRLTTRTLHAKPEISSITWNSDGTLFAATMLYSSPTIYALSDPFPIATCSGETYSNCCTMKHGSFSTFGLGGDEYYAAGSDDFRAYIWKLPSTPHLFAQRESQSYSSFSNRDSNVNMSAFTESQFGDRIVPTNLNNPHSHISGHRSIVNSAILHPSQFHLLTAGIQSSILLHSPTPYSPCTLNLQRTNTHVRQPSEARETDHNEYVRTLLGEPLTVGGNEDEERTIRMFDYIVRTEGGVDLFDIRGRSWDHDDDSDSNSDYGDHVEEYTSVMPVDVAVEAEPESEDEVIDDDSDMDLEVAWEETVHRNPGG